MRSDLPRDLVLAVVPNTRGIAFAYFEGALSPVDWGMKDLRGSDKNGRSLAAVRDLIEQLQPDVLILEEYSAARIRRAARAARLQRMIESHAAVQAIEVTRYTRANIRATFSPFGATTRYEIAELIAGQVLALSFRLPPVRKLWMSEDHRMALFDAAALVFTHFKERGFVSGETF